MVTDLSQLRQRQIHIWFTAPEQVSPGPQVEQYLAMLDDDERALAQRLRLPALRHTYIVAHALVRTSLSRYASVEPQDWSFVRNRYGKPEIAGPPAPPLRFNLSHTDGAVACAVGLEHDIGVDVENAERTIDFVTIARSSFSTHEQDALNALAPDAQRERFFSYWTLKEAYIKARGMGLSIPLDQFSFHLEGQRPVHITFDPRLADHPHHWQFARLRPSEGYLAAVALRRREASDHDILAWETVPLTSQCDLLSDAVIG